MSYSIKADQITEEERRAAKEKPFRNGSSYSYLENADDNGFQDAYNELVRRIRHTRQMYKDQLDGLTIREAELKADIRSTRKNLWISTAVTFLLCLFFGFRNRIAKIAVLSDFSSTVMVILEMVIPIFIAIFVFFFIPLFGIQLVKQKKTRRILEGSGFAAESAKKKGFITFRDERTFLKNRIANIDDYMDQLVFREINRETETLRKMDLTNILRKQGIWEEGALAGAGESGEATEKAYTGVLKKDPGEHFGEEKWTAEQQDIIAKMRSLSLFREYRASTINEMTSMSYNWAFISLTSIIGVFAFIIYAVHH